MTIAETIEHIREVYGRGYCRRTLLRWLTAGCPGRDGRRVRLQGFKVGGFWAISPEAVAEFAARLTGRAVEPVVSPAARKRAADEAMKELAEAGWA